MGKLAETIGSVLSRLAELLGLKASEKGKMRALRDKLSQRYENNKDNLDALKQQITSLQVRARRQKAERDKARGENRKIVEKEISQTFREIDRATQREEIITANLDKVNLAQEKISQWLDASERGVSEDELDDVAIELKEAVDAMRVSDRAATDLDRVRYEGRERPQVDVETRMTAVSEVATGEAESTLTSEEERRLAELEQE